MKKLKEGDYYLVHPSFRSVIDDEDFTDMVSDFSKFSYLGVDVMGDGRFIKPNEILKFKEEKDMEEMGMKRELTPEERIEQIDKEKEMLLKQIKNQAECDEMRKAGEDLALAIKAIQDSGFSREEAMQIFTITMMCNMIPPFLRR